VARDGRLVPHGASRPNTTVGCFAKKNFMYLNYNDRRFLSSMRIAAPPIEYDQERFLAAPEIFGGTASDADLRRTVGVLPGTRIREVESAVPPSDRYLTVLIFVVGMLMSGLAGYIVGLVTSR
jgi:hypothetical protein